jgi:tyrosine ammonia-lyase
MARTTMQTTETSTPPSTSIAEFKNDAQHAERAGGAPISQLASTGAGVILQIGRGSTLTAERVEAFARDVSSRVRFTDASRSAMADSAEWLGRATQRGDAIYGLTTGFGPHVKYAADSDANKQGEGLICHLAAGCGALASAEVVRATMVIRAHTIGLGGSGIEHAAADAFVELMHSGLIPAVPEVGSVGASGDLIPLSHIARVLLGSGKVVTDGKASPCGVHLAAAGIEPIQLSGRDALALVNGTAFMTAYASLAVARAERLVQRAEEITGWMYRLLGCREQALDPRLHVARGHAGQCRSAATIRAEAERYGAWEDASRPLQEVYSLRCAPQFLGACRDQLTYARQTIERELNGVNDNPLIAGPDAGCVLHGGNFQGQQIAFASDMINTATVQAAILAERQLDVLCNPDLSGGPLLLAWSPGATSGFAGAQITASSLIAELRQHQGPCATASVPTNGRNQDVVSMGTMAARHALAQTERLAAVLAIAAMATAQLNYLRRKGRAEGKAVQNPAWFPSFVPVNEDRPLFEDIERIGAEWLRA